MSRLRRIHLSALATGVLALVPVACRYTPEPGDIETVVGTGETGLDEREGTLARETETYLVHDLAFGPDGGAYFLDWNGHRIRRWDLSTDTVRTIAGTGVTGDGPEGPALATRLNHPTGLFFDAAGGLLVAAWHSARLKRIDLGNGIIEDLCGTGARGFVDDAPAEEAVLDLPSSIVVDQDGVIYFSDQANNRIRYVSGDGFVHTYAGTGAGTGVDPVTNLPEPECLGAGAYGSVDCYVGDGGPALEAAFSLEGCGPGAPPQGKLALDAGGNLYVADSSNHVIRRIEAGTTIVTTIAGTGVVAGYAGDGGPATAGLLNNPTDIALGPDGTLYIADSYNNCIRSVRPDGVLTTVAGRCGTGPGGYDGDRGPATEALLDGPMGVEVGPDGNLYIADSGNSVIRVVHR